MKKVIAESLARVHTHTHTHTLCLLNKYKKENKIIDMYKKDSNKSLEVGLYCCLFCV